MRGKKEPVRLADDPLVSVPWRPILRGGWLVVDVQGSKAEHQANKLSKLGRAWKNVDPDVFRDFVNLTDADESVIEKFASTYGFIGLCRHGGPATHAPSDVPEPDDFFIASDGIRTTKAVRMSCFPFRAESVDTWRKFSRRFRGILDVSSVLRTKRADRREWIDLFDDLTNENFPPKLFGEQRSYLAAILSSLIHRADIRPVLMWQDKALKQPTFALSSAYGMPLFSALVVQLLHAVARVDLVRCDGCGKPYWPLKAARSDRSNYCPPCQRIKKSRRLSDAKRDRIRTRARRKNEETWSE
jgi:hypothetical protein